MKNPPAMYQLKMIIKGTKPPVWRRGVVPGSITFTQLALILEEMLELPKSERFEFEFFQKKERIIEWIDGKGTGDFWYSCLSADDTYINDWMDHEKWFTFRLRSEEEWNKADSTHPQYRVEIEKKLREARIDFGKGMELLRSPVISVQKSTEDISEWPAGMYAVNEILAKTYVLDESEKPIYATLTELIRDKEKGRNGIAWCSRPVNRTSKDQKSAQHLLGEFSDTLKMLFEETKGHEEFFRDYMENPDRELSEEEQELLDGLEKRIHTAADGWARRAEAVAAEEGRNGKTRVSDGRNKALDADYEDLRSIEGFLAAYGKEPLVRMANQYGISTERRGVKRLSHEIARHILEPSFMRRALFVVDEKALDAFEAVLGRGVFSPDFRERELLMELANQNYIGCYTDGSMVVPRDVETTYRVLLKTGYRDYHRSTLWLAACEKCFSRLLAVGPLDVLRRMYEQGEGEHLTTEAFKDLMTRLPEGFRWCRLEGEEVQANWAVEDEMLEIIHTQQETRDVPWYIPTVREVKDYLKAEYPFWEPSYQEMGRFYRKEMKLTEDETQALLATQFQCANAGAFLSAFMKTKEAEPLVFSSEKQIERFTKAYSEAHTHTRSIVLKGHTPAEMSVLTDGWKETQYLYMDDIQLPVSFDPSTIKGNIVPLGRTMEHGYEASSPASGNIGVKGQEFGSKRKKIYPNDPCPCGSGKKYKQCCGRKKK